MTKQAIRFLLYLCALAVTISTPALAVPPGLQPPVPGPAPIPIPDPLPVNKGGTGVSLLADPTGATDATSSLNANIAAAISAGKSSLTLFSGGTYAISDGSLSGVDGRYELFISGANNFTLDCNGATLLNTSGQIALNNARHLMIENSNNVTLKNCKFDDKYLQFSQTTLTNIGATYADFTVLPGYDFSWSTVQQIEERVCPSAATVSLPTGYMTAFSLLYNLFGNGASNGGVAINRTVTSLGGGVYRVAYAGNDTAALANLVNGHCYMLMHSKNGPNVVHSYNSTGVTYDGVKIYAGGGSGFYSILGSGIEFKNSSGTYRKPGTDRWVSVNSDNHIGLVGGVHKYTNFNADGNADDGINDFGVTMPVTTVVDANHISMKQFVSGYGGPVAPIVGDTLQAVNTSGYLSGSATISAVSCDGANCSLTLAGSGITPLDTTYYVTDTTQAAQSLSVTGSAFSMIRGHGIAFNSIISTIGGNTFSHITQGAIYCPQTAYGFNNSIQKQGPYCDTVSLYNNKSTYVNYEEYTSLQNGLAGDAACYEVYVSNISGSSFVNVPQNQLLTSTGNSCEHSNNFAEYYGGYTNINATGDTAHHVAAYFQTTNYGTPSAYFIGITTNGYVCNTSPPSEGLRVGFGGYTSEVLSICQPQGNYKIAMSNAGSYTPPNDAFNVSLSGYISSYTLTMPASPQDGQVVVFSLDGSSNIPSLTINANTGQTLDGVVGSVGPSSSVKYKYRTSNATWSILP